MIGTGILLAAALRRDRLTVVLWVLGVAGLWAAVVGGVGAQPVDPVEPAGDLRAQRVGHLGEQVLHDHLGCAVGAAQHLAVAEVVMHEVKKELGIDQDVPWQLVYQSRSGPPSRLLRTMAAVAGSRSAS